MKASSSLLLFVLFATPVWAAGPTISASGPTAYACTLETLEQGSECFFDSDEVPTASDPARQQAENARAARELSERLCPKAARVGPGRRTDPDALAACKRDWALAAESCELEAGLPFLDARGRFVGLAQDCYQELGQVFSNTQSAAQMAPGCCQCLAQHCGGTVETCYRNLLQGQPEGAQPGCLKESCASQCTAVAPPTPRGTLLTPPLPPLPEPPQPQKQTYPKNRQSL